MNPTKRLTGVCGECGGSILFPAEQVGTMTQCPRCGKQTELSLPVPVEEPLVPRKILMWPLITIGILVLGLIITVVGLKHFADIAERQKARTPPKAGMTGTATAAGFEVSPFTLEKGQDDNGTYAVGTVVNSSNRPRSRVTLEVDLLDAEGHILHVLRAYRPMLEAGAKWEIKLSVKGGAKAVTARLASLKEGQ